MADVFDLMIIGGGPAGLTAAVYASRARLNTMVLEGGVIGGQAAITDRIDNYPGFPQGVTGADLAAQMEEQARKFGAFIVSDMAESVDERGGVFYAKGYGGEYAARAMIVAPGCEYRRMAVPGEEEFIGRGVSFCATCDAAFYRNQRVAVIGGGDSAVKEALYLTKFASEVVIVHRRDQLRAEKIIQEEAFANPKISFSWNSVPVRVNGGDVVTGLLLRDVKSGAESELAVDGVFVFIGMNPRTAFLTGFVGMDPAGYVIADGEMATSRRGVFAAGDVRSKQLRQVSTAVGDGATAAFAAEHYLEGLR
ncbi:MAG: thioredoxin-disulfide reductase [Myxococcota bacterium]|jgi:thioredoxin reductase (NADPH)